MARKRQIDTTLNFRIPANLKRNFTLACDMRRVPASMVLRKLISGYVSGKYTIEHEDR